MDSYKTRLKDITTFIFDVDGVMTNGKIIYTHDGKIDRQFNAKDGYAIKHAISKGYRIAIISGGMQENVRTRLNSLGVEDVFLKAFNKIEILDNFMRDKGIEKKIFFIWVMTIQILNRLRSSAYLLVLRMHLLMLNQYVIMYHTKKVDMDV